MKKYSDDDLLNFIREVHAKHGYITATKWSKIYRAPSVPLMINRFDGYLNAWHRAGIDVRSPIIRRKKWTREVILKKLQTYEYAVSYEQWVDKPSTCTIVKTFGSWSAAWEAAGISKNREDTEPKYWEILSYDAAKYGYLSRIKFNKLHNDVTSSTIINHLGKSWSEIWAELGYTGSAWGLDNVYTDEERQVKVQKLTTNPNWDKLKEYEKDTLLLIAAGYSLTYIARLYNISIPGVYNRRRAGERKLYAH